MSGHGAPLQTDLSPAQFERFAAYILEHSGIHIEESRFDALRISLVTRATRFGHDSFERYYDLLVADEAEFRELLSLITINETSFFRFPAQFEALRGVVVPEILDARSPAVRSFRVWSAGCSTGEEPYSIAMTLLEAGIDSLGHRPEVLGTDVSTSALERAEAGVYPPRTLLNVPRDIVGRYFEPTATGHQVADRVREVVSFRYQNLVKEPYPTALMGAWDVIFCRNVTIYFRVESTRRVVDHLFESLNPGGYLFIGHSETLTGISDRFETVEVGGVFLHRRPPDTTPGVSFSQAVEIKRREGAVLPSGGSGAPVTQPGPGRPRPAFRSAAAAPDAADDAYDQLSAARAFADEGDFEQATAAAEEALRVDPLCASARYILGLIHLRAGREDEAIAQFRRTIVADGGFALAHLNLGNIHRARGEYDHACRAYSDAQRALERAPDGPWTEFLGGFEPEVLSATCARSLAECARLRGST